MRLGEQYSTEDIELGMSNYQAALQALRKTHAFTPEYFDAAGDMAYWEQYTLAAGAMSMQMCALPHGPENPDSKRWVEQRAYATKQLAVMRSSGLPVLDIYK